VPKCGIEIMGGLEYFDFGFVMKEMGKSMPRGTKCGGGSKGRIVINYLRLNGVIVSIHGWVALSFFKCPTTCLLVLKYVLMGWTFDACTTF